MHGASIYVPREASLQPDRLRLEERYAAFVRAALCCATGSESPTSIGIGFWRLGRSWGYVTVTPSLELRVSRRIREEFENGHDYYALEGASVRTPLPPAPPPSSEYLEWHGDTVFRR